jgi:Reverse transcriptase (RNA-dependent DNA polymerase)
MGEVPEALPGSTLERGIYEEKRQELERPSQLLKGGRASQRNEGGPTAGRKSDPLRGTQRTGEPSTGGRGGQECVTGTGNRGRIGKAGVPMPTSLRGISKKAESEKQYRLANLFGLLTPSMLKETWRGIRKSAAAGVDRVEAREYEKQLKENVENLVDRLKRKSYRARLIRRRLIPKGNGRKRPLGIPVVEDKLLQLAVAQILEAIYEEDFLRCSYGYRPRVGAHDAVGKLTVKLHFGRYGWVVEADIQGLFDQAS